MSATTYLLLVPAMTFVVLSFMLLYAGRRARTLGLGLLGICGAILGGPAFVSRDVQAAEPTFDRATLTTTESSADLAAPKTAERDDSTTRGDVVPVVPHDGIRYLSERPDWVKSPPEKFSVGGVTYDAIYIESGPWSRIADAEQAFDRELERAAGEFLNRYLGNKQASRFVHYDADQLRRYVRHEFREEIESPTVGTMHQKHGLLVFDHSFHAELDQVKARYRLLLTVIVCGAVLALIGTAFTYFRLDNATRGFYTGRLQFLAVAAILALIAAGVLVARWIPWM